MATVKWRKITDNTWLVTKPNGYFSHVFFYPGTNGARVCVTTHNTYPAYDLFDIDTLLSILAESYRKW